MGKRREWTQGQSGRLEKESRSAALASAEADATGDDPIRALIINLEGARDRLDAISERLDEVGVTYERVPGMKGSDLSVYATRRIAPNWDRAIYGDDRAGTLGCFLGHIRAWEHVSNGDGGFYLILEDDARPLGPVPRSFSSLNIPDDVDLCFANNRMERMFMNGEDFPSRPTLFTALEARNSRPPFQKATGGEAYFLNKSGADKLLEMMAEVGPFTHVDWFLFIAGIGEKGARELREDDRALKIYNRFQPLLEPVKHIELNMMSLWPALMARTTGVESTRRAENAA